MKLLTVQNPKILKDGAEWATCGIHLAPADLAIPGISVCPWSTPECRACCLNTSGHGRTKAQIYQGEDPKERSEELSTHYIHKARIARTLLFINERPRFMYQLYSELVNFQDRTIKKERKPAARLNLTSDLSWENFKVFEGMNIMEALPKTRFYDYTKSFAKACTNFVNYHITYSASKPATKEEQERMKLLRNIGVNTAVVFNPTIPDEFAGFEVINGDENDHRFLDKPGVIVGLTAKGRAKKFGLPFVIPT